MVRSGDGRDAFEAARFDPFVPGRSAPGARAALDPNRRAGYAALGVMEGHLTGRDWFAGGGFTIADIALYAYTHVAGEGGFDLEGYPAVRAWLGRVAAQPGHVPITQR